VRVSLEPHPATPSDAVTAIDVDVARPRADLIRLRYHLTGDLRRVRMPVPRPAERTDDLWRHTCFEAFVRVGDAYWELNLAPSTQWAAYRFDGYRAGMMPAMDVAPQRLDVGADSLTAELAGLPAGAWSLGISAVIEEQDGTKSYWALAHPSGKPDFHHPDCFTLDLPPPV
jgi:hypothetical protein